jgi:hypothetical protein
MAEGKLFGKLAEWPGVLFFDVRSLGKLFCEYTARAIFTTEKCWVSDFYGSRSFYYFRVYYMLFNKEILLSFLTFI